jgi:Tetracyclin repressor-like, C-terminal domain
VQAVISHQAHVIAGNQRQADLGSPEGLRAWRDMVIAQARSGEAKGGRPLGSLAGQLAETDPHARTLLADGFGQWQAAIGEGLRRLHQAGQLPDGTDPDALAITLLATLQGGLLLAQVQRDSRPWKRRSTPSSNSPEAAARMFPQAAESPHPRSHRTASDGTGKEPGRNVVPADKAGLAVGLLNASQQLGTALGSAIFSAIATARTAALLTAHAPRDAALTQGFHRALLVCAFFLLAAAVIALRATNSRGEPVTEASGTPPPATRFRRRNRPTDPRPREATCGANGVVAALDW